MHATKGPWVTDGGWEYDAVLIDHAFGWMPDITGTGWEFGALAAGVLGEGPARRRGLRSF